MDNKELAVSVKDLKKTFRLPHEQHSGIKQLLVNRFKGVRGYEDQEVLKGISFDIKKGDFFGIVGRNGSGKSTLLKLLAEIYTPNAGSIKVNGSLVPFIELGVGFNPELTGRENIFLNGALLGFSRKEMEEKYDSIVEFSEIDRFIDQKLKNYSSGMQVRLAFSIAIRAQGDILLLDEVLAVGDEAFQRKCFNYFEQLKRKKRTVILVTHDMSAVERFCNKALFLEDGEVKLYGDPRKIAAAYSRSNDEAYNDQNIEDDATRLKIKKHMKITVTNEDGKVAKRFTSGDKMNVTLDWDLEGVKHAGVAILRQSGEYIFGPNTFLDNFKMTGKDSITFTVTLNVSEGEYFLKAGLFGDNDSLRIDFEDNGPTFVVNRNKDDHRWGGFTKLDYEWK